MDLELAKEQICDVCHKTWQLGWVAANDGNVSARLEDGTILCTPTGMSKSFITPEKLLRIDSQGNVLEGMEGLRPSSEMKMHLRCYEKRPDVGSVLHAHPPGATGFAVAHKAMDMYNMIEDVAVIGMPDPRLGEIAAAIIEIKEGMTCTREEIDAFCQELPRYKRPRKVIFDRVPRNPTGKIEKPVLREKYCHGRLVEAQITH